MLWGRPSWRHRFEPDGRRLHLRRHLAGLRLCRFHHRRLRPTHRRVARQPDSSRWFCPRCPRTSSSPALPGKGSGLGPPFGSRISRRFRPVVATFAFCVLVSGASGALAGVLDPSVLRGLPLSAAATTSSSPGPMSGAVRALGKVLAQEPVGVLVRATLPCPAPFRDHASHDPAGRRTGDLPCRSAERGLCGSRK